MQEEGRYYSRNRSSMFLFALKELGMIFVKMFNKCLTFYNNLNKKFKEK